MRCKAITKYRLLITVDSNIMNEDFDDGFDKNNKTMANSKAMIFQV